MRTRLAHSVYIKIGRRGLCLALLGVLFILVGISNVLSALVLSGNQARNTYRLAIEIMPMQWWGALFIVTGTLAIISSRWPPGKDAWGFGALTSVAIIWACVYFAGWLIWDSDNSWLGGSFFTVITILLQVIAGWPEDPESYHEKLEGERNA